MEKIREAKIRDYKEVIKIQKSGYGKVNWWYPEMFFNKLRGGKITLIESVNKGVVGYLEEIKRRDNSVHILNICFYKEYQGDGYGTKLMKSREDYYKSKGINKISLHTKKSWGYVRKWYESLGFVEKRVIPRYYKIEDGIRYEKELKTCK